MTDNPSVAFQFTWENVKSHCSDGDYITCPFCQQRLYKLSRTNYYRSHYNNRCYAAALVARDDTAPPQPPSSSRAQEAGPDGFLGGNSLPEGVDGDDCQVLDINIEQVSSRMVVNSLWRICSPKAVPVSC
jgi:hypothetical protein